MLRTTVVPEKVVSVMAEYDLIAVPSRWLETGPLVVLEAFAAGVPVLGSNLGGIAELVRDGVDGILVAPNDAAAWAVAIGRLVEDRNVIDALRCGIAPPRTMDQRRATWRRFTPNPYTPVAMINLIVRWCNRPMMFRPTAWRRSSAELILYVFVSLGCGPLGPVEQLP